MATEMLDMLIETVQRNMNKDIKIPFSKKLLELIIKNRDRLTPQQNLFADYLIKHSDQLAFHPVAVMAKKASVSESTIVRFCRQIGYKGYAEFTSEIQQGIQLELTAIQRFRIGKDFAGTSSEKSELPFYAKLFNTGINNLTKLIKDINQEEYNRCIELMLKADRLCVIGCLECEGLAQHMGFLLRKVTHHTDVINYSGINAFSSIEKLTEKSIVFLLTFSRYSKATCELARISLKKKANIISITDSPLSPTVPFSNLSFFVPCSLPSYSNDYTAVMSFITVLSSDFGNRMSKSAERKLKQFDAFSEGTRAHTTKC